MNTRIDKFIESEGLTAARFADAIGVQRSNVSHVLSGRNKPSYDFIEKMLSKFSEINAEWLILGKGNMYKESHTPSLFNVPIVENLEAKQEQVANTPSTEAKKDSTTMLQEPLPLANSIAIQSEKRLARILLCYTDGSFEVFDRNAGSTP